MRRVGYRETGERDSLQEFIFFSALVGRLDSSEKTLRDK